MSLLVQPVHDVKTTLSGRLRYCRKTLRWRRPSCQLEGH